MLLLQLHDLVHSDSESAQWQIVTWLTLFSAILPKRDDEAFMKYLSGGKSS
jgi:hypothetical protein